MRQVTTFIFAIVICVGFVQAQINTTTHIDGLREKTQRLLALTNVTLVPEPGVVIEGATVVVRNSVIEGAGKGIQIPNGATIVDAKGMWCYAGFIDIYTNVGVGSAKKAEKPIGFDDGDEGPNTPIVREGRHWNLAVKPENSALLDLNVEDKSVGEFRKNGFTVLQTNSMDGLFRGSSAVILAKGGRASEIVLSNNVQQWLSFRKGSSKTPYPSSLMGSIALMRQVFSDALWYGKASTQYAGLNQREYNASYEALSKALEQKKVFVFETENEHGILRANKLAQEFQLNALYEGNGFEYKRLSSLTPFKPSLILPLSFPDVPDVTSQDKALDVSLEDLLHWDAAPSNPYMCDSAGLQFAFTLHGLKNQSDFFKNLRKAISRGLTKDKALAALTTTPASLLGIQTIGKVKAGNIANLVLSNGDIFADGTEIQSVYISGELFQIERGVTNDVRGYWNVTCENLPAFKLSISGSKKNPNLVVKKDSVELKSSLQTNGRTVTFTISADTLGFKETTRFLGTIEGTKGFGSATLSNGTQVKWTCTLDSVFVDKGEKSSSNSETTQRPTLTTLYPRTAFGLQQLAKEQSVLFKNATVWTSSAQGVLKETDVLVKNGVIESIGKNLKGADLIVDATNKHLTPGIIDEHSHIAIEQGVNEGTHAITAEVRIGDVLQPDDVNIYRQLSGGVTSSHLLHGSANPIGGQLQHIKLRWGQDADGLKFKEAAGTIKFALGENVKQANWGDRFSVRYPQTRMGVEEIMRDGFRAALEYERLKENAIKSSLVFRKDYQLETLLEIIRGKRFIHCHSYVQSEILMLMRLAEEFKFNVKTFTHILEGYKVAGEMKEHGTTASSFADWWDYKFEVYDAIPQNPAILTEAGVITSINSDDAEMARRLNQEAAKSVKYGGMNPEDALKMVTINPAIQLGVQNLVGSIEKGKHADVVLWSGNPLSNTSRVLQTWVDGKKYFDTETDAQLRERDVKLRAELEQKALKALGLGEAKSTLQSKKKREYDCEDVHDEVSGAEEN